MPTTEDCGPAAFARRADSIQPQPDCPACYQRATLIEELLLMLTELKGGAICAAAIKLVDTYDLISEHAASKSPGGPSQMDLNLALDELIDAVLNAESETMVGYPEGARP